MNGRYALSSRAVAIGLYTNEENVVKTVVCCAICHVSSATQWIGAKTLESQEDLSLRPVVTLGENVMLDNSDTSQDHSKAESPWKLK